MYQIPGQPPRRWFASKAMDLIVWLDAGGGPIWFQLCYDRERAEKALTWRSPSEFSHDAVDDGEGRDYRHKASPILAGPAPFDAAKTAAAFEAESADLPHGIARLVLDKIAELGARAR